MRDRKSEKIRDRKVRNGAIREERGDGMQGVGDTLCWVGSGPKCQIRSPLGKLRCWADCVQGLGVKLQESGENVGVKEAQGTELV